MENKKNKQDKLKDLKSKVQKIKKAILQDYEDMDKDEGIRDNLTICEITQELERLGLINFTFEYREDESDDWLQCEYFSKKIGKTIIFDYDAPSYFDNYDNEYKSALDKFIATLLWYQKEIIKFEKKLTKIK
jgi:hypothetical protein